MKKTLSLLLTLFVFSGITLNAQKTTFPISEIGKDFPTSQKVTFKLRKSFEVECAGLLLQNNTLWCFSEDSQEIGFCYDMNTGEKISVIDLQGANPDNWQELTAYDFVGDSIMLCFKNTIKTFAQKDILNNVPVEKRKGSVIQLPNTLLYSNISKLPDGTVLTTISPAIFENEKSKEGGINNNSVVLFNGKELKGFQTINYNSFNLKDPTPKQTPTNELIKWTYAQGNVCTPNCQKAVFSLDNQFILYTLDLNTGKVLHEKRYTEIQREDVEEMSFVTINELRLSISQLEANDKYIVCLADGYFNPEDKIAQKRQIAIFVFDWNLKPVKRIDLPSDNPEIFYLIDSECKSVYSAGFGEEGLEIHQANLNL